LTFPATAVQTASATTLTATLINPASGSPVTVTGITVIAAPGTAAGEFTQTNTCPAVVAPGANCVITVSFTPSLLGTRAATLSVSNSETTAPLSVALTGTGTGSTFTATPLALQFPNTVVNTTSAALSVALRNNLPTPLTLSQLGLAGPFSNQYAIAAGTTCSTATAIASGVSCTINVTFNAKTVFGGLAGIRPALLNVASPVSALATSNTASIAVNGTAILYPVDVTPKGFAGLNGLLMFPNQYEGTAGAAQVATLTNYQSTPVTFVSASMPSQFKIVAGATTTCTVGAIVAPNGGTCTIAIQFAPTSLNQMCFPFFGCLQLPWMQNATLNLTGSGGVSPTITLVGTPVPPAATLAGNTAFNTVRVGTTSAAHAFTYTNTGIGPITVSAFANPLTGSTNFAVTTNSCVGAILAPSATCQISVTFTPTAAGNRTATLTVTDTLGNAKTANLTGTGLAAATTSAASLAFANTNRGAVSATQTITLSNPAGNPAMTGTSIAFGGTNANYFRRSTTNAGSCLTTATFTVNAGNSCTIGVVFAPPAASAGGTTGAKSGKLSIGTTSTVPPPAAVTLSGTAN
jgi:hypothetical protein